MLVRALFVIHFGFTFYVDSIYWNIAQHYLKVRNTVRYGVIPQITFCYIASIHWPAQENLADRSLCCRPALNQLDCWQEKNLSHGFNWCIGLYFSYKLVPTNSSHKFAIIFRVPVTHGTTGLVYEMLWYSLLRTCPCFLAVWLPWGLVSNFVNDSIVPSRSLGADNVLPRFPVYKITNSCPSLIMYIVG